MGGFTAKAADDKARVSRGSAPASPAPAGPSSRWRRRARAPEGPTLSLVPLPSCSSRWLSRDDHALRSAVRRTAG